MKAVTPRFLSSARIPEAHLGLQIFTFEVRSGVTNVSVFFDNHSESFPYDPESERVNEVK